MKIRKFLSTLLACMLLGSLLPSAEAIDCAIYDAYAPPAAVTAHRASDAGPRSFMTADADEAGEDGVAFHPYVFTVGEDASVTASVQLQSALMVLSDRAALLAETEAVTLDGDGTSLSPYKIGSKAQLEKFRDIVNGLNGESRKSKACAVLTADIDLENTAWTPIGPYTGVFDGCGHVISGLNVTAGERTGLFASVGTSSAKVTRLGVKGSVSVDNVNIAYAGGIVGYLSDDASISECWFEGSVRASITNTSSQVSAFAGGIAGYAQFGNVSNCYSVCTVHAENLGVAIALAGGIVGSMDQTALSCCYHAQGGITASARITCAGGILGNCIGDVPEQCYYLEGTANRGIDTHDDSAGVTESLSADAFANRESFSEIDSASKTWDFERTWYMDKTAGRPMLSFGKAETGMEMHVAPDYVPFGAPVTVSVHVYGEGATGNVTLTVSGAQGNETYVATLTDGDEPRHKIAEQNITLSHSGKYDLTAKYEGNEQCLSCQSSAVPFEVGPSSEEDSWRALQDLIDFTNGSIILHGNVSVINHTNMYLRIPDNCNITIDLNGFTIDRNQTTAISDGYVIYVGENSTLTLVDSNGTGSITGGHSTGDAGAIFVDEGAQLLINNITFANNHAGRFGGAIFANNNAMNVTVWNATFNNNTAYAGGAIFAGSETNCSVTNCSFVNNQVDGSYGAIHVSNRNTAINSSMFLNNSATGGGVVGAAWDSAGDGCNITDCVFIGNDAGRNVIGFANNDNKNTDFNWFGSTADDYENGVPSPTSNIWRFLNLTRMIDGSGNYMILVEMPAYNRTNRSSFGTDYNLPVIVLDGYVQGAETNGSPVLVLSRDGHTGIPFVPSTNGTAYTIGCAFPGHPEISENLTFERKIEVNEGQPLVINVTGDAGATVPVNITALENDEAIPGVVIENRTITVVSEGTESNLTLEGNDTLDLDPSIFTPGTHDATFTVPGFAPTTVTVTAPKWAAPLEVDAPQAIFLGEVLTVTVKAPENATGNITLSIRDGASYNETFSPELTDGVVSQTVSDLPLGTYTINASYPGDDNFLENSAAVSLSVVERAAGVTVTAQPVAGGNVTGAGNYTAGAPVTVTAQPATGYDFVSWTENGTVVSENATYTFTAEKDRALTAAFALKTFAVSFVDEDGTELLNCTVNYGETAKYTGDTPTKAATAQYTFTFAGWNPELAAVTGNATYTATYSKATNQYTVRFVNDDGTQLQSGEVAYGATPKYTGATPTKAATAQYTFTFAGWTPELTAVTANATYTATYSNTTNKYPVKFLNEDGYVLAEDTVAYGETPVYTGETPTKASTPEKTYTFLRWDPALAPVTGAQSYYAVFSDTDVSYTIRFLNEGGAELQRAEYKYGETPEYTGAAPTKNATAQYTYAFAGWTPEIKAVTGDQDYTATFNESLNKYTVRFVNYNGTELQATEYAYGATPAYTGATPTKAEDAQYTYAFDGWTPALAAVTGNATYTASFKATEKQGPTPTPTYDYVALPAETRFDVVDPGKGGSLDNFKRGKTYAEGTFTDVDPAAWYFENIVAAFEYALMEGMGDGTFGVGARLKLSEALALACRLHNIYYGGSGKFDQTKDANWYTVYEDYAVKYGIIQKGQYDLTKDATRAQFAAILSAALPDAALKPINDVKQLPDMAADDPRLPAILRLYNAGILTGVDAQGSFQPDAFIPREQIAAMATRIADPALRKAFTLA